MPSQRTSYETSDSDTTPPRGYNSWNRDFQVGAISQEEAERKRAAFLNYLDSCYTQNKINQTTNKEESFSLGRNRASYTSDSYQTSSEIWSFGGEVTRYGSLSRGSRLRSSLPIVRTRSRSRESPLGIIHLEYSGQSRAAVLPNEVTSLDTIRALFVQAYPGLLTMPMLNPQRHTLLLKNKKDGTFDEINNISRIKDRSTVRARPTGIPTPGKKPPVSQKPNVNRNKPPAAAVDPIVAEKNQKNHQRSGLKAPVKSLTRQGHTAAKQESSDPSPDRPAPHTDETPQKPLRGKAPPPPPRSAKPTALNSPAKHSSNSSNFQNISTSNDSLRTSIGLGGGSFPHKGFSYVSSTFSANQDEANAIFTNQKQQSDTNGTSENLKNNTSPRTLSERSMSHSQVQDAEKTPEVQPRTYAGSSMASQTAFSTSLNTDTETSKLIKPKSFEPRLKIASRSSLHRSGFSSSPAMPTQSSAIENEKSELERKNTLQSSTNSPLFGLTSRSYKGNQPKPFSIPTVPDCSKTSSNSSPARTTLTTAGVRPVATHNSVFTEQTKTISNTTHDIASSGDEVTERSKSKPVPTKKGLFGLRKVVSSKHENAKTIPGTTNVQNKIHDLEVSHSSSLGFHSSPRSPSISESYPSSQVQKIKNSLKSSPINSNRKAAIPKTNLLHSIFNKSDSQENPRSSSERLSHDNDSQSSFCSDNEKDLSHSSSAPGLNGVLKNSALVKSTSSSSILTDSGASNLSTTLSIKIKKVSFQDNVTVCDGDVISTFRNSLRHPELDDQRHTSIDIDGQSLSYDVAEGDTHGTEGLGFNCRHGDPSNREVPRSRCWPGGSRLAYEPTNNSWSYNGYNIQYAVANNLYSSTYSTCGGHQSAVAAAIQSISGNSVSPVQSTNRSSAAQARPMHPPDDHHAVSCASSVPFVTRQDRGACYKEEWEPLRRRISADANPHISAAAQQRSCVTPSPDDFMKETNKNFADGRDGELSYFQTQSSVISSHQEQYQSDTPPYYECCAASDTASPQVTANQLHTALDLQENWAQPPNKLPKDLLHAAERREITTTAPSADNDGGKLNRMVAMERQLSNLTGVVESIITSGDNTLSPCSDKNFPDHISFSGTNQSFQNSPKRHNLRQQLLFLRNIAHGLKQELKDLKKQQRSNMEYINDLVQEKSKDVAQFVASTAGAQHRPLRLRRIRLDQQRHTYGTTASRTEKQLSDVEAGVEELRNEVVERRCRVNAREVEALVLQLSQAGRTIAQLKGSFPALCEELRTVAAAETEVIYAEEKFAEAEPIRLDEQLKRCKQLTSTLYTLKKLANVQEARSKTPTPLRPMTPSQVGAGGASDHPDVYKNRVLTQVKSIKVDHPRRMASIQEAEISWTRRRKFILEYDSKKLEKALEMAEKALNRTDYISQIEERRRAHLIHMYNNRTVDTPQHNTNLTRSESSSIESLPPPPPSEHMNHDYPSKVPLSSGFPYPHSHFSANIRLPPSNLKIPKSSGASGYGVVSPDVGYLSSDPSPDVGRITIPPGTTGSLPRYANSGAFRMGYGMAPAEKSQQKSNRNPDGTAFHLAKPMERSRSVTPQNWNPSAMTAYPAAINSEQSLNEVDRRRVLEHQQMHYLEKNKKLQEQYSKLQQMQKRQRLSMKKSPTNQSKMVPPAVYQHHHMALTPGAKSSDV